MVKTSRAGVGDELRNLPGYLPPRGGIAEIQQVWLIDLRWEEPIGMIGQKLRAGVGHLGFNIEHQPHIRRVRGIGERLEPIGIILGIGRPTFRAASPNRPDRKD